MADIVLTGNTSGAITVAAPAVAGSNTLTLPANTGTLMTSTYTSGDVDIDSGTLHVDATNNRVGIGTSSPAHNVEIVATASGSVNDTLQIRNNATDTGTGSRIRFINSTDANSDANGASIASIRTGGDNDLTFETENAERMRIDASGDVGIGMTTPGAKLGVTASATGVKVSRALTYRGVSCENGAPSGETTDGVFYSYTGNAASTNFNHFGAQCGGSVVFKVLGNGNVQNTNNSYGALSDIKLKENIVDATPKLESLMQVKVRNYNLIGDDKKQLGVVAQELEQVFPSMIEEIPDRNEKGNILDTATKSVKYSVFVPMLIKAIQELKTENDTLKSQLSDLETRIQALENA